MHEGDEIVAPVRHDVGRLLHHFAVAPDAIARQVGADVEIDAERGNAGIADIGHADDRARLWIELAEPVKRGRELLGQDREIALDETVGDAGRGGRPCRSGRHAGLRRWAINPPYRGRVVPSSPSWSSLIPLPILSTSTPAYGYDNV